MDLRGDYKGYGLLSADTSGQLQTVLSAIAQALMGTKLSESHAAVALDVTMHGQDIFLQLTVILAAKCHLL